MKRVALALFILTLVVTGAVAKQTCKEMADEKKLAGAVLNSFMTKCASDATSSCAKAAESYQARQRTASRRNA